MRLPRRQFIASVEAAHQIDQRVLEGAGESEGGDGPALPGTTNFVRLHRSIRCIPAMEAGIASAVRERFEGETVCVKTAVDAMRAVMAAHMRVGKRG